MDPPNSFICLIIMQFLRTQCVQHCARGSGEEKGTGKEAQKKQRSSLFSIRSPYIGFHLHRAQPFCAVWVQSGRTEEKAENKSQLFPPCRWMCLGLHVDILLWGSLTLTCRVRRCTDKNIWAEMALSGRLFFRGFFFLVANCVFVSRQGDLFPSSNKRLKGTETVRQSATSFLESVAEVKHEKGSKFEEMSTLGLNGLYQQVLVH